MSPTSFQLLYSAILGALFVQCLCIIAWRAEFVNLYFLAFFIFQLGGKGGVGYGKTNGIQKWFQDGPFIGSNLEINK